MTEYGITALDEGTFITNKEKIIRKPLKERSFFFSNTFPFIGMVRLMRIAHKK